MSMSAAPLLAGVAMGTAVWLAFGGGAGRRRRLAALSDAPARPAARIGIAAALAAIGAFMRNGGSDVQAFEELAGRRFPTRRVTEARAFEVFDARRGERESERQARSVARDVTVACRISERLGCETVRCLNAVADAYRRTCLVEELRAKSLAMPEATVRLLSALPVVTLMLGEVIGADPIAFLFGSVPGLACLAAGLTCYALGLVWVTMLLRGLREPQGAQVSRKSRKVQGVRGTRGVRESGEARG